MINWISFLLVDTEYARQSGVGPTAGAAATQREPHSHSSRFWTECHPAEGYRQGDRRYFSIDHLIRRIVRELCTFPVIKSLIYKIALISLLIGQWWIWLNVSDWILGDWRPSFRSSRRDTSLVPQFRFPPFANDVRKRRHFRLQDASSGSSWWWRWLSFSLFWSFEYSEVRIMGWFMILIRSMVDVSFLCF